MTWKLPAALAATLCLTIPLATPLAAGQSGPLVARYFLGSGLPGGVTHFGLDCAGEYHAGEGPLAAFWIGGACLEDVAPGSHAITVTDDLGLPVAFWVTALPPGGPACIFDAQGVGSLSIDLPVGCTLVDVTPVAGSLAGTIRVS